MDPQLPIPSTSSHLCKPSPVRSKRPSLFAPEGASAPAPTPAPAKKSHSLEVRHVIHSKKVIAVLQNKIDKLRLERDALTQIANNWCSTAMVYNMVLANCPACTLRIKMWQECLQQATLVRPPTLPPLVPMDPRLNNTEASGSTDPRQKKGKNVPGKNLSKNSNSTEVAMDLSLNNTAASGTKPWVLDLSESVFILISYLSFK